MYCNVNWILKFKHEKRHQWKKVKCKVNRLLLILRFNHTLNNMIWFGDIIA